MEENLKKLVLLAMKAQYDKRACDQILQLLKKIFATDYIKLNDNVANYLKESEKIYIPIYVDGVLYSFYEIKNANNQLDDLVIDTLSLILSQMYTNIYVNHPKSFEYDIDISTNVYNRNAFEKFKKYYNQCDYNSVGCIFVDINSMNEINNTFGHSYGDNVIYNVATSLSSIFKDGQVFRIGGDEFVVILKNTNSDFMESKISAVRKYLEKNNIYISVGINFANYVHNVDNFIKETDQLMYSDKQEFYRKNNKVLRKKISN